MAGGQREFGPFRFDASDGRLENRRHPERHCMLRPQVAGMLDHLLDHPDTVVDRDSLYHAVWDEDTVVDFESGLAAIVRELRRAMQQVGDGADRLETVPRRGYRLHVHSRPESSGAAAGEEGDRRALPRWGLVLVAAVVLAATLLVWLAPPPTESPARELTLAIVPFTTFAEGDDGDRRHGLLMADSLLAGLWQVALDELVLIGRAALQPYRDRDDIARAVAGDLDVTLLLEGTVTRDGENWRVDARLLSMPSGRVVWSHSVTPPPAAELPARAAAEALIADLAERWPALAPRLKRPDRAISG